MQCLYMGRRKFLKLCEKYPNTKLQLQSVAQLRHAHFKSALKASHNKLTGARQRLLNFLSVGQEELCPSSPTEHQEDSQISYSEKVVRRESPFKKQQEAPTHARSTSQKYNVEPQDLIIEEESDLAFFKRTRGHTESCNYQSVQAKSADLVPAFLKGSVANKHMFTRDLKGLKALRSLRNSISRHWRGRSDYSELPVDQGESEDHQPPSDQTRTTQQAMGASLPGIQRVNEVFNSEAVEDDGQVGQLKGGFHPLYPLSYFERNTALDEEKQAVQQSTAAMNEQEGSNKTDAASIESGSTNGGDEEGGDDEDCLNRSLEEPIDSMEPVFEGEDASIEVVAEHLRVS